LASVVAHGATIALVFFITLHTLSATGVTGVDYGGKYMSDANLQVNHYFINFLKQS
jgi:hypothetical protein